MKPHPSQPPPLAWHRRPGWRLALGLLEAGAALALAGTLLGFLGRWHWAFDLFAHFRGQYFAALAGTGVLLGALRRPRVALVFLAGAAVNATSLAPLFRPGPRPGPAAAERPPAVPPLRVITANLLYHNPDPATTIAWLRATPADVVFLCEVTPVWSDRLRALADLYPHQDHHPQADPFGCAVLSRVPWTHLEIKEFISFPSPSPAVRFNWHGREILLLGMHPPPPIGARLSGLRDAALAQAANFLAHHPVPTRLLVGDLNTTPWSRSFRVLTARAGLTDTARGHGWQPTWNVRSPFFQIPIDHVLVSPDLIATDRRIGPDLGSDHRAVVVTLQPVNGRP